MFGAELIAGSAGALARIEREARKTFASKSSNELKI